MSGAPFALRAAFEKLLGREALAYLLHLRPMEWPIMTAHLLLGALWASGLGAFAPGAWPWTLLGWFAFVALLNGGALALLVGGCVAAWFGCPVLGLVMGAALVINILTAGLAGILVPLTLEKFGHDPAVASSVFVTMCTDCMGFLSFLGLATLVGPGHLCGS